MHSAGLFLKAAALTALVASTSVSAANCNVIPNMDRPGFDLANVRGNVNQCDSFCEKQANCLTWTWNNYLGGTCWLKSHAGKLVNRPGVTATSCVRDTPSLVCNDFKDIDFIGMDIASRPGKTAGACCDICNEYPGCTAYAWNNYLGGTCWLKKAVGQTVYKPGTISSSTRPLYGGVCAAEYNVDYVGNDIGNKPAKDAGICCGVCKANKDCKAYTWSNHNGGTCWMKSGKGKTAAKSGVTSATIAIF